MVKKTVLITGSNSGIGRATAELLAGKGYKVFASMRNLDKGRDLAEAAEKNGWDVTLLRLDVRDEGSVAEAIEQAGRLDVLVNNAGFEVWGPLEEMSVQNIIDQFDTNVYGPFRTINAVLPGMRQRGGGVIVNVSSVAGRVAAPLNGAYAASKWALEALTESLHYEAGHFGVRFHIVEPGGVETPFPDNRQLIGAAAGDESSPYAPMLAEWLKAAEKLNPGGPASKPEDVANAIVEAIETGDKLRYPVGADANMVLMARKAMDDETFEKTMRERLELTW